jgi:enoyl-CoA hydratase/carnithine racemase
VQDLAIEPVRGHPISGAQTRYLEQPMPDIVISNEGPVRKIRMNRPEKKNALTLAMYETMAAAIEDAGTQTSVRCLLLAGAPDVFCAGNDLNDFVAMARSGALGASIVRFLHVLARCEKPLVAAVSGAAVGIGTTMLLHCDQVIASDNAVLLTPFVSLGLLPEAGCSLIAPRLIGHARAFSLLVMGKPLSATDARAVGIVNAVVPAAELDAQSLAIARDIAALPPESVATARRLMRGSVEEVAARIDEEVEAFRMRLASPEAQAALAAFLTRKR